MSSRRWRSTSSNGGGVAWFVGSQTNRDFYNDRLYRNGEGLVSRAAHAADATAR